MEPRMYKTLPAHYQPCHISDLSSGKMLLVAFIRHREIRQRAATIRVPPPPRHVHKEVRFGVEFGVTCRDIGTIGGQRITSFIDKNRATPSLASEPVQQSVTRPFPIGFVF
uniref:Uncharacterized protein n=1 Tax=Anopheles melas TaxID=34690 RepID=A0A182U3F8_9DIPT